MGLGTHIQLCCKCGYATDPVMIGHLLAHETAGAGFTVLAASFDVETSRVIEHQFVVPRELESMLSSDPTSANQAIVDDWVEQQCEAKRRAYGNILSPPSDPEMTVFACPRCRSANLELRKVGDWIA